MGSRKKVFYLTVVFGVIGSINTVLILSLFGLLVDRFSKVARHEGSVSGVLVVLGYLLAAYFLNAILSFLQERGSNIFRHAAHIQARAISYEHLERLPATFFDKNRPGAVMQRANNAVGRFINWLASFSNNGIYTIAIPVFSLIPIFYFSPLIGIVVLIGLSCSITVQVLKTSKRQPLQRVADAAWEDFFGVFGEIVANIQTARTSFPLKRVRKLYDRALAGHFDPLGEKVKIEEKYNFLLYTLEGITIVTALVLATKLGLDGEIGVTAFVAILGLVRSSVNTMRSVGNLYDGYTSSLIEAERYLMFLDEPVDDLDATDAEDIKTINTIEFKDVTFDYPDGKADALNKVSFSVSLGENIAIVGKSGSGKTTVTKLIQRFYAPNSGLILINGKNIGSFTQESLRAATGSVMQEVVLFHTTIRENINFVKPGLTDGDLWSALRMANADGFVKELADGLDTVIGERGVRLSGGQRQRIAIARAVIKDPSFVLLDEATSALDSVSEKHVQAGLTKLLNGRTAITIAHRLSTISHADKIIVMDKGKIVEQGTFEELKKAKGTFADLLTHQQL